MEDAVHSTTTGENRELPHHSKVHTRTHRTTDNMGNCNDKGDKTIEGMGTDRPQLEKEGAQDDMRSSPKRPHRQ